MNPEEFTAKIADLPLPDEEGGDDMDPIDTLTDIILRAREITAELKRAKRPAIKPN